MTIDSFRAGPKEGLLDIANRVISYLDKFKHVILRIRTEEPNSFSVPITPYEWEESVHGKMTKILPQDASEPK